MRESPCSRPPRIQASASTDYCALSRAACLRATCIQHLCSRPLRTPYAGGGALVWPPPAVLPSTNYAAGLLGQGGSAPGGGGVDRNDLVLEEVASR